ncbi:MAG: M48 family metalloprotease [Phycisphaerae bacterium]|nr:M48 family metalloprotease [Phycisphaerae bacterium]
MNALTRLLTDPHAARLALALLHLVWQAALVAVVLAVLLRLLDSRSANARYLLSLAAMALVAVAPVVTFVVVEPPPMETAAAPLAVPVPPTILPGAESGRTIAPSVAPAPPMQRPVPGASAAGSDSSEATSDWSRAALEAVQPYLPHVVAAWTVGVLLIGLWRLGGWMQVRRLTRLSAAAVPAHLELVMETLARRLGVSWPVRLVTSAVAGVPTMIGWLRPMILLPVSAAAGLTPEQLEVVLAHELAHIRRHDYLVNLVQVAVETLLFYHPAVWWISARIRSEREHCCDDLAVAVTGSRAAYARALERMASLRRGPVLAMSARGGRLLTRVRRILGLRDAEQAGPGGWLAGTVVLAAAVLVLYVCAAGTADAKRIEPDEPKAMEVLLVSPDVRWPDEMSIILSADVRRHRRADLPDAVAVDNSADAPLQWQLDVDGQRYQPPLDSASNAFPVIPSSSESGDDGTSSAHYRLADLWLWNHVEDGTPLKMVGGTYRVRAIVRAAPGWSDSSGVADESLYAVSNEVNVTVGPADVPQKPAAAVKTLNRAAQSDQ